MTTGRRRSAVEIFRNFVPADFALAVAAFLLLAVWRAPPWLVVVFGALAVSRVAIV